MPNKDHPLLFTSDMVRAILEDRKTQTRRVPVERYRNWKVGELIWVKEDYKYLIQGDLVITYYKFSIKEDRVGYTPLNFLNEETRKKLIKGRQDSWKSKLLMFKFMARIWLKITGLRDERVQEISVGDCQCEGSGYEDNSEFFENGYIKAFQQLWDSINAARHKGIYAWDKNPLDKVIEFKRVREQP